MIRALIFDCFGVIVTDVFSCAYQHFGGDPDADRLFIADTIAAYNRGMISEEDLVENFAHELGILPSAWREYMAEGHQRDERILRYILELRKDYKVGLLSNMDKHNMLRQFSQVELDYYFNTAVVSGDVGMSKPDPRIYQLAAERLDVRPDECVMIDDVEDHCRGAQNAGMHAIYYKGFKQLRRDVGFLLTNTNH